MKKKFFSFSPKFCIVFKCFKTIFPFSSCFQYENEQIFIFPKISFTKSNCFQMFQMFFSVFKQFYEIPKWLEKQFCSRFKIQNAYENNCFQKRCPSLLIGDIMSSSNPRLWIRSGQNKAYSVPPTHSERKHLG